MKLRASLVLCLCTALCLFVSPAAFAADLVSGKVVETMNGGGYTYVLLENEGQKTWVAVPRMEVTVGSQVSFTQGMVMTDFESKTLKRKFDRIIFSGGPAAPAEAGSAQDTQSGSADTAKAPAASGEIKVEKLEKASGANGRTVSEIHEKGAELAGKAVAVRGKVVKFSSGIMGKNWLHLQDGSGSQEKGDNDLVVTTKDEASAGETVTATGTLLKDQDYGFGYKYAVIIEDASLSR